MLNKVKILEKLMLNKVKNIRKSYWRNNLNKNVLAQFSCAKYP